MAVLIEATSVVIRIDSLMKKFPGGWGAFKVAAPSQTLCSDQEIARVGFAAPQDAESFVKQMQAAGLEYLRNGKAVDMAIADGERGPTAKCTWLEFGRATINRNGREVAICRLAGSTVPHVATPPGWQR
jgi:cold shock CspA family protein